MAYHYTNFVSDNDEDEDEEKSVINNINQSIIIDCKPGYPRPGHLIDDVIKDLGLPKKDPVSKVFGEWTWNYYEIPKSTWKNIVPIIKERITKLYHQGTIRHGEC